jgi:hypothetical protein
VRKAGIFALVGLAALTTQALAQVDMLIEAVSKSDIFTNSVLGIAVVALVYFVMILRAELRDTRAAHKIEVAEKDKLIYEQQEARISEAKAGADLAKTVKSTLDALMLSGRKG